MVYIYTSIVWVK